MNVQDITTDYLKANGYDGLFHSDTECGCPIDDLFICDALNHSCEAGYRQFRTNDCGETCEWAKECSEDGPGHSCIGPKKFIPGADDEWHH